MTIKENQPQNHDKQYKIPMELTDETIKDFNINPDDVVWWNFGEYHARAILVPATKEQYLEYMRPFWREQKWIKRRQSKQLTFDDLCETTLYHQSEPFSVESEVMKKILIGELGKLLEELEEIDQTIMKMYADDQNETQIASKVGMSQKGVNKRKHKIFEILRKKLKKFD